MGHICCISSVNAGLDIGYVPAVPNAFLRLSGQFGPPQFIFHWPEGPVVFFFFFFLVLRMPPLFLLGIGKTRKATLIRSYFSLYIGLMYKSVQLHVWNHKFPPRKHLGHYMFLGGQWFFGSQWIFWFTGPPGQWLLQSNVKAWNDMEIKPSHAPQGLFMLPKYTSSEGASHHRWYWLAVNSNHQLIRPHDLFTLFK